MDPIDGLEAEGVTTDTVWGVLERICDGEFAAARVSVVDTAAAVVLMMGMATRRHSMTYLELGIRLDGGEMPIGVVETFVCACIALARDPHTLKFLLIHTDGRVAHTQTFTRLGKYLAESPTITHFSLFEDTQCVFPSSVRLPSEIEWTRF